jgi:hypothetical protein
MQRACRPLSGRSRVSGLRNDHSVVVMRARERHLTTQWSQNAGPPKFRPLSGELSGYHRSEATTQWSFSDADRRHATTEWSKFREG